MKRKNIFLLITVFIILAIFVYWLSFQKAQDDTSLTESSVPIGSQLKTFQSETLDFTVQLPENYVVDEDTTFADLKLGENIISVIRNYDPIGNGSLGEYLDYADSKNEIKSTSGKKELVINGYQAASRNEVRGGINKKAYYIYVSDVDKIVYVFSTKSESLYSDLDQIAQSFRYTP
ncbi:hypothetical protein A2715_00380 [Candidatus Woesebacteria bacterium RIFCSPHIGHO2_01_FULL_39_32]|uniref:PsbP C-terminal domain-containing protein n=2 Tax=Candidatus Woeseibacteriota TaxID=1752722 RepID=A0A0G0PRV6_9BACT|nr:MAG: hypothetical protein UT61_C0004G0055 [Candidatus Woesebacteria bacterium GW2011_GWA1_39_8]OGM03599.1 MAG: hypothetical protein A2124_01700 [Candidatus Woesebacteria bacterium GWB1_37_5]OGM24282.1 MAG: hypothetical protein A2715_00380 [Candidatus Woesebacteria bacterium RIFCSPHIGHO2_01_FULL_39_32]OGM35409.1 MAG: hypothetical protein A3F01_04735 [Candidatus Woesebacteria bacterium RIFCSPHIGHO2_12_FULL_38_11]OGM65353.1 MAG: hypothetical protein A2893_01335 [Candidatus Woesebacteria bacteri